MQTEKWESHPKTYFAMEALTSELEFCRDLKRLSVARAITLFSNWSAISINSRATPLRAGSGIGTATGIMNGRTSFRHTHKHRWQAIILYQSLQLSQTASYNNMTLYLVVARARWDGGFAKDAESERKASVRLFGVHRHPHCKLLC